MWYLIFNNLVIIIDLTIPAGALSILACLHLVYPSGGGLVFAGKANEYV